MSAKTALPVALETGERVAREERPFEPLGGDITKDNGGNRNADDESRNDGMDEGGDGIASEEHEISY